jgi:hypothetical protein
MVGFTVSGIDSIQTVFTEIGENAPIQRQLITPLTHADLYEEGVRRAPGQISHR